MTSVAYRGIVYKLKPKVIQTFAFTFLDNAYLIIQTSEILSLDLG